MGMVDVFWPGIKQVLYAAFIIGKFAYICFVVIGDKITDEMLSVCGKKNISIICNTCNILRNITCHNLKLSIYNI